MADARSAPQRSPRVFRTDDFEVWSRGLSAERRAQVEGAIAYVAAGGPTLGRPHVDRIHGSRVHKLKEARVGRGTRLLFAFDSNRDLVMLLGGDKTGTWNRWYPRQVDRAERLYLEHERNNGKDPPWQSQVRRTPPQRGR